MDEDDSPLKLASPSHKTAKIPKKVDYNYLASILAHVNESKSQTCPLASLPIETPADSTKAKTKVQHAATEPTTFDSADLDLIIIMPPPKQWLSDVAISDLLDPDMPFTMSRANMAVQELQAHYPFLTSTSLTAKAIFLLSLPLRSRSPPPPPPPTDNPYSSSNPTTNTLSSSNPSPAATTSTSDSRPTITLTPEDLPTFLPIWTQSNHLSPSLSISELVDLALLTSFFAAGDFFRAYGLGGAGVEEDMDDDYDDDGLERVSEEEEDEEIGEEEEEEEDEEDWEKRLEERKRVEMRKVGPRGRGRKKKRREKKKDKGDGSETEVEKGKLGGKKEEEGVDCGGAREGVGGKCRDGKVDGCGVEEGTGGVDVEYGG